MTRASLPDTIVCLPITEWAGMPHNSRHLMVEAARRGYRVLWVDPLGLRSARLQRKDLAKLTRRLRQIRHPLIRVGEGIWRLAPVGVPLQGTRLGAALNRRLLAAQIRLALRKLSARRVLLWSYSPQLAGLRSSIDCDLAIYYRTDDYSSAPGVNAARIQRLESEAASLADLCISGNELSLADLPDSACRRLLVRNGVDLSVFNADSRPDDPIPQITHPRLLVIGTFDRWIDTDLLRGLALEHPEWSLVLAGERKIDLSALTALANVTFLGRVPFERLPALIAGCDVGLVAHRVEPYTIRCNPGKIYQYLALGTPVVCTPFTDASVYSGQIHVCEGEPAAFANAIESLLSLDSPELAAARRAFAAEQSWATRFDAIENELTRIPVVEKTDEPSADLSGATERDEAKDRISGRGGLGTRHLQRSFPDDKRVIELEMLAPTPSAMSDPVVDTVVCFSITEWSAMPQNSHHLMREAARRGYRVLYIDPLGLRRVRLRREDIAKILRRVRQASRPLVGVEEGITRLAPIGIPLQDTRIGAALNRRLLIVQIRRALRRMRARSTLLWSYSPHFLDLSEPLGCDLSLYYRVDDYATAPYISSGYIEKLETRATELADLCIAANKQSAEVLDAARERIIVPNGIDLSVYGEEVTAKDPIPEIDHPRLLFAGTFDTWVDVELLRKLALANPDWSIVLAGEVKIPLESLTELPQVHFLGLLPYHELPALMSHCDVGLVPYHVNRFTTSACIGKIYQYLAMGLPVVSTPVLEPSDYGDHVVCAPGYENEYGNAIAKAIAKNDAKAKKARRTYALRQSWAERFNAIESEVRRLLEETHGSRLETAAVRS